jgi:putative transcriptional regulator
MKRQYKSKIMAAIYETVEDLHEAQIMPAQTLQRFDALCLAPMQELTPQSEASEKTRSGILSP